MLIAIIVFLPESPRYKLQTGHPDQARSIMSVMRGTELIDTPAGPRGDYDLEGELAEMQEGIDAEARAFAGRNYLTAYALCFSTEGQVWKRTIHGMMLQTMQQLNGQNFYYCESCLLESFDRDFLSTALLSLLTSLFFLFRSLHFSIDYGPTFFKKANIALNSYQIQFILGAVSWVATFPALITIEKVGRRKSLLIGSVGCATCAFIVAFVGRYGLAPDGQTPNSSESMAGNAFV